MFAWCTFHMNKHRQISYTAQNACFAVAHIAPRARGGNLCPGRKERDFVLGLDIVHSCLRHEWVPCHQVTWNFWQTSTPSPAVARVDRCAQAVCVVMFLLFVHVAVGVCV